MLDPESAGSEPMEYLLSTEGVAGNEYTPNSEEKVSRNKVL